MQLMIKYNISNIDVSMYRHITDRVPEKKITLMAWLFNRNTYYTPLINKIRKEDDYKQRKALKLKLPSITPSGRFAGNKDVDLLQHSGFIGIDIDNIDPLNAKDKLAAWPHVYYVGLSVSGRGVWALVPIEDPEKHREHFPAIKNELAEIGLDADPMCINVSRKRFYSIDRDPFINETAEIYQKTFSPKVYEELTASGEEFEKVKILLSRVQETNTDITRSYYDWIKVGGVLVSCFGEAGRSLFHDFSRYYPMYNKRESNHQYDVCLKNEKAFGLGMLYHIAAKHKVYVKRRP